MTILYLTILASLAALVGGVVAIKSRHKIYIAMALVSGLILGLVAFDLLPEVFEGLEHSGMDPALPMLLFVLGFIGFHSVEKFVVVHQSDESTYKPHTHPTLGVARALVLVAHSLLDGLSIGLAFQVDPAVGYAVALAVIAHRFADGFDTTSFMIFHGNSSKRIKQLLGLVVVMPIIGGLASLFISVPETALTLYLAFFAGLLMYIASSNILPQAHTKYGNQISFSFMIFGIAVMYFITRFAHMH